MKWMESDREKLCLMCLAMFKQIQLKMNLMKSLRRKIKLNFKNMKSKSKWRRWNENWMSRNLREGKKINNYSKCIRITHLMKSMKVYKKYQKKRMILDKIIIIFVRWMVLKKKLINLWKWSNINQNLIK